MNNMDLQVFINASLSDFNSTIYRNDSQKIFEQTEDVHYPYFGDYLAKFRNDYGLVHGYLSFAFCVFGITANFLNVIVLTHKNMLSPTNAILTGLALADMLVMFSYLPFTYHNYIRTDIEDEEKFSYKWAVFTLFHGHFTVVFHTISTWLTVTVAIWRFLAVSFPQNTTVWCNMTRAKYAIFLTYAMSAIFCIPAYFSFSIYKYKDKDGAIAFIVNFSETAKWHDGLLRNINFWIFSVIFKLVPCVLLTGISFGLVKILYEREKRRKRLKRNTDHDRTTKMLLAVLLLFLMTEFPSGLLALLSGILGAEFFDNVYVNFGDIMDALALINSAINFIIYCTMSQQFRITFASFFFPDCIRNKNNGTVSSV